MTTPTSDHEASPVWCAIVNDLVGGWAVANDPLPMSASLDDPSVVVIADMMNEADARLVSRLLNEAGVVRQHTPPKGT